MAAKYNLLPNEYVILTETSVAHGATPSNYSSELMLTNLNIVCTDKGMFGNIKNIFQYPVAQIRRYNGKPQTIMGKHTNGTSCMEVFFVNGRSESFSFYSSNKSTINKWIKEIDRLVNGGSQDEEEIEEDVDPDSFAGAVKEIGSHFKEAGQEFLGSLGFKTGRKKEPQTEHGPVKVSKKCISCSAPLVGYKDRVVKCKYCDTEQTL